MSKAAIVTGASSGIGLAISRVLCEKGYEVYGFGRDFAKRTDKGICRADCGISSGRRRFIRRTEIMRCGERDHKNGRH